ncbi:MAG TPA: glycosyltransferase 87 family protein [Candidatus Binatia bacterium]|nr:glycosyltransferase 87 family protein [Candidatus Binatia bacterium]
MKIQQTTLLVVAGLIGLAFLLARPPSAMMGKPDFDAFYCAGKVLANGGDPYRYGSMHRCETTNLRTITPHAIVPAPLPPYGIAEFVPLSMMPYAQASVVWFLLLIGSAFVIIWAIVELTGLPLLLIAPCVLLSILFQPLTVSGLPPIPIALLTAAALAVDRGRHATAAVLLGIACIQPHVAAGPVLATFLVVPRMQLHLAIVGAALLAISLIAGGIVLNYEYLNAVLPAHALSEIGAYGQYSLSALLHLFGASDRSALLIGTLQYIAFLIAGIGLAYGLHAKVPGSVVLAPLACGVTGGTFIHLPEVSGALPFAFVLLAAQESICAWLGVVLLAIPWQIVLEDKLAVMAGVVAFVLIYYGRHGKPVLAGAVSLGLTVALWYAQGLVPNQGLIRALPSVPDSALAEAGWARFSEQLPPTAFYWPSHVLTFLGLAFVYWTALIIVRSQMRYAG